MITKTDLRMATNIQKDMAGIRRKLNRKRKPLQGQERAELEAVLEALEEKYTESLLWLDDVIFTIEDIRTQCLFMDVYVFGEKQRDLTSVYHLSEQRICNLIRAGIKEINEKTGGALRTPGSSDQIIQRKPPLCHCQVADQSTF